MAAVPNWAWACQYGPGQSVSRATLKINIVLLYDLSIGLMAMRVPYLSFWPGVIPLNCMGGYVIQIVIEGATR